MGIDVQAFVVNAFRFPDDRTPIPFAERMAKLRTCTLADGIGNIAPQAVPQAPCRWKRPCRLCALHTEQVTPPDAESFVFCTAASDLSHGRVHEIIQKRAFAHAQNNEGRL